MIAIGESNDGASLVILSDAMKIDAGMGRLELSEDAAYSVVAQLTHLLDSRAERRDPARGIPPAARHPWKDPGEVLSEDAPAVDAVEEARRADAAAIAKREREEAERERRRVVKAAR